MTIPEAAQLVLQSFFIGKGGDVFLLDMGEPVKITDLARNLILLSGLKPDRDIKIQFTGLRPGEKLFEELSLHDESLLPTMHTKIRRYASSSGLDMAILREHLWELQQIVDDRDVLRLVKRFKDWIPDYSPSAQLLKAALTNDLRYSGDTGTEIFVREEHDRVSATFAPTPEIPLTNLECPANFVPADMRQTGTRGGWDGAREEAYSEEDCEPASADRSGRGERQDDSSGLSKRRNHRADVLPLAQRIRWPVGGSESSTEGA
jgi:hypothetical protein